MIKTAKLELDAKGTSTTAGAKEPKLPTGSGASEQKKPRRVVVKGAMFYLYKVEVGNLSLIDTFGTDAEIRQAYGEALDSGLSEGELEGFKSRRLVFEVKETKRRITVR